MDFELEDEDSQRLRSGVAKRVSASRRVADEISGHDGERLAVPGHLARAGENQVELLLRAGVGVRPDAGARWQLRYVYKVAAAQQGGSIGHSSESNQSLAPVGPDFIQVELEKIAAIEQEIGLHEYPTLRRRRKVLPAWVAS